MSLIHEVKPVPDRKPILEVTTAWSHLQHLLRFLDGGGLTHSWERGLHMWLLINEMGRYLRRQITSASECVVDEAGYLPLQKTIIWVLQPTTNWP